MYNIGLIRFCQAKHLDTASTVNGYLQHKGVSFSKRNQHLRNDFIQDNWTSFASWVDKGIKSGKLNGKDVRLNYSFAEQREYKDRVKQEHESVKPTQDEEMLLQRIRKEYSVGFIQSFLMKKNIKPLSKDDSYFSKRLQWLPLVRQAISEGILKQEENGNERSSTKEVL